MRTVTWLAGSIVASGLMAFALAGCSGSSAGPGGGGVGGTITSLTVATAESQADARALANDSDLPAIATADRLVVTDDTGKSVTTTAAAGLDAVRAALTVRDVPPSGGMTWATLQWFKGETKVREVWVYGDGEWGVHRPGVSWTLGRSPALVTAIKSILNGG